MCGKIRDSTTGRVKQGESEVQEGRYMEQLRKSNGEEIRGQRKWGGIGKTFKLIHIYVKTIHTYIRKDYIYIYT